jgi:hypothetical protein
LRRAVYRRARARAQQGRGSEQSKRAAGQPRHELRYARLPRADTLTSAFQPATFWRADARGRAGLSTQLAAEPPRHRARASAADRSSSPQALSLSARAQAEEPPRPQRPRRFAGCTTPRPSLQRPRACDTASDTRGRPGACCKLRRRLPPRRTPRNRRPSPAGSQPCRVRRSHEVRSEREDFERRPRASSRESRRRTPKAVPTLGRGDNVA